MVKKKEEAKLIHFRASLKLWNFLHKEAEACGHTISSYTRWVLSQHMLTKMKLTSKSLGKAS